MDDAQTFFPEATLRICSSLQIETAFARFFQFVKEYIPAQEAYLHYYVPSVGGSRFFVQADAGGGKRIDVLAVWPEKLRQLGDADHFPLSFISNRADTHPMSLPMLKVLGKAKSSVLTVRLTLETNWVGGVSLWAEGWERFNQRDLDLLAELREPFSIALSNYRRYQELKNLKDRLEDDYQQLKEELADTHAEMPVGSGLGLKGVMDMVRQVAPLESPVLVLGETGTGKELITRAIHRLSRRKDGPFVKLNCGALAPSLMDSELFGHEKGAYTGAVNLKRGRFERAHGGTLFLDEIGELPLDAQVKLLRVLQEKELERVGGTRPIPADIRLIATTNRDLEIMIREGDFRRDLYFRLQVFPIVVPPLRERMCDLPTLVYHFMQEKTREMKLPYNPTLAPGAMETLMAYHWPGNVRELENIVERELILSQGGVLTFSNLITPLLNESTLISFHKEPDIPDLNTVVRAHIQKALRSANGKVEGRMGAAEILGLNPGTLRHRMRKLNIPFGRKAKQRT